MGRLLQGFVIVAVAVLSALVYSYRDMTSKTARSIALLQQEVVVSEIPLLSPQEQEQAFNELPPVVQTYLKKAIPNLNTADFFSSVKHIKSLTMKQKGTFKMASTLR